ncbi:hypothetical protein FM120_28680 [Sphingobacterium faecium PCAi_F2.5]|nr:hypothetical protein FM120_28680 [Sphingobacterium faecium PCAi_F2.5]
MSKIDDLYFYRNQGSEQFYGNVDGPIIGLLPKPARLMIVK